jgi:hypothetical protein
VRAMKDSKDMSKIQIKKVESGNKNSMKFIQSFNSLCRNFKASMKKYTLLKNSSKLLVQKNNGINSEVDIRNLLTNLIRSENKLLIYWRVTEIFLQEVSKMKGEMKQVNKLKRKIYGNIDTIKFFNNTKL